LPHADRKLLDQQKWGEIYAELLQFVLTKYGQHDPTKIIAVGISYEDAVSQAIEETIDGPRFWDPIKYPKLINHLRWAVWSIISNLRASLEAKKTEAIRPCGPDDDRTEDEILASMGATRLAEVLNEAAQDTEYQSKVADEILSALCGDQLLEKLYDLLAAGMAPRDIADKLGLATKEIYNLKKLLLRRLKNSPFISRLAATKRSEMEKGDNP
jgi:hypothetical protein